MKWNQTKFCLCCWFVLVSKIKDVSVSDAEIVDYMKKNEKRFKTDETREVEYVLIEDKASKKTKQK
jgi:peptidyl-prolyl cis-trans isomerase D